MRENQRSIGKLRSGTHDVERESKRRKNCRGVKAMTGIEFPSNKCNTQAIPGPMENTL
jgi:hypothetical protein